MKPITDENQNHHNADNNENENENENENDSNKNNNPRRMVIASPQEIIDDLLTWEKNKKDEKPLIEPGSHNLLIYHDLKVFHEIYSQYARTLLAENEIVLIATQYDAIEEVKNTLRLVGIDVENCLNQGTLFIIDAQQGFQGVDSKGVWKFGMSLLSRAKKEGKSGVGWFADLGSFFNFGKIEELMQYELWLPEKNEDDKVKIVCCYHLENFGRLNETEQHTLFDHHPKSILML